MTDQNRFVRRNIILVQTIFSRKNQSVLIGVDDIKSMMIFIKIGCVNLVWFGSIQIFPAMRSRTLIQFTPLSDQSVRHEHLVLLYQPGRKYVFDIVSLLLNGESSASRATTECDISIFAFRYYGITGLDVSHRR